MWAILSDVHANLEALTAVLDDVGRQRVSRTVCLGDVLGYGPDPLPCVDLVMRACDVTTLGNHDQAVMFDPDGYSGTAERAIFWHRACLEQGDRATCEARWTWIADRPRTWRHGPWLFLHASPRDPINEYLFPEDVYNGRKMGRIFDLVEQVCFSGHTHVPGVFAHRGSGFDPKTGAPFTTAAADPLFDFLAPSGAQHTIQLPRHKAIVNVGSVGQPRDGDRRACYALFDGDGVTFRRVEYDAEATIRKIHANPELSDFLGDRLREGR